MNKTDRELRELRRELYNISLQVNDLAHQLGELADVLYRPQEFDQNEEFDPTLSF